MIARRHAFAFGMALAGWAVQAAAAPTYTQFDATGAGTGANQGTLVSGINNAGIVVGSYLDGSSQLHAYLRADDGTFQFFDVAGQSGANAVNGTGKTVGFAIDGSGTHGVIDSGGVLTSFDAPGATDTEAQGLTTKGKVVGFFLDTGNAVHGFARNKSGGVKPFDAPGAGTGSSQGTFAFGVLLDDSIAGYVVDGDGVRHGFMRDRDRVFTVFDPPNSVRTSAITINDFHTIGGSYRDSASVIHGFLRNASDGSFTIVDAPGAGTGALQGTSLHQVNDRGVVVGTYSDSAGVSHGYIRNPAGKITSFDAPGAHMVANQGTVAQSINGRNVIAGYYYDAAGATHGFIRKP